MTTLVIAALLAGPVIISEQGSVMGGASVACYHDITSGAFACYSNSGALCEPGNSYDCGTRAGGECLCTSSSGHEYQCNSTFYEQCEDFSVYNCGGEVVATCDSDIVSRVEEDEGGVFIVWESWVIE